MLSKIVTLFAAVLLLAACETAQDPNAAGTAGAGGIGGAGGLGGAGGRYGEVVPGSQADLQANVGDRVFFALDRSELTPEARATLDRQADWLRRYPNVVVTVEGHCDERGTREYNIGLGLRRATAVRNYLLALGIDAARLDSTSYGKERPEVVGANEGAWAQNRRAVTVVN